MNDRLFEEPVVSHPDRKPHKKACSECAFRKNNPQGVTDEEWSQFYFEADMLGAEFYCVHRVEDGCNRICASFAAIYGIKEAQVGFEAVTSTIEP